MPGGDLFTAVAQYAARLEADKARMESLIQVLVDKNAALNKKDAHLEAKLKQATADKARMESLIKVLFDQKAALSKEVADLKLCIQQPPAAAAAAGEGADWRDIQIDILLSMNERLQRDLSSALDHLDHC